MPKCAVRGCKKFTIYKNTIQKYCPMHLARIRRHGYLGPKKDAWQSLEKLPHKIVDKFILDNHKKMFDEEITKYLKKKGVKNATVWNVKYRRRKLGIKKYLYGEIKKHKAWIRAQAIKKYGNICELCGYNLHIETHHIIPKYKRGRHEIDNLIILCSNCHALLTNKKFSLKNRKGVKELGKKIKRALKSAYPYLG